MTGRVTRLENPPSLGGVTYHHRGTSLLPLKHNSTHAEGQELFSLFNLINIADSPSTGGRDSLTPTRVSYLPRVVTRGRGGGRRGGGGGGVSSSSPKGPDQSHGWHPGDPPLMSQRLVSTSDPGHRRTWGDVGPPPDPVRSCGRDGVVERVRRPFTPDSPTRGTRGSTRTPRVVDTRGSSTVVRARGRTIPGHRRREGPPRLVGRRQTVGVGATAGTVRSVPECRGAVPTVVVGIKG